MSICPYCGEFMREDDIMCPNIICGAYRTNEFNYDIPLSEREDLKSEVQKREPLKKRLEQDNKIIKKHFDIIKHKLNTLLISNSKLKEIIKTSLKYEILHDNIYIISNILNKLRKQREEYIKEKNILPEEYYEKTGKYICLWCKTEMEIDQDFCSNNCKKDYTTMKNLKKSFKRGAKNG